MLVKEIEFTRLCNSARLFRCGNVWPVATHTVHTANKLTRAQPQPAGTYRRSPTVRVDGDSLLNGSFRQKGGARVGVPC